jgi:hypothetical protein
MTDQTVHPDADRWGGWTWREPSRGEHFRRCGFCGSIHPEDIAAEPIWRADWADMKYGWPHKFYVDIPNRQAEQLFVVSASSTPSDGYTARADLTDEQREIVKRDGWNGNDLMHPWNYFQFSTRPTHHGKFYSIHLRDNDLSAEVKATIEQRSGLTFEFLPDGRVSWRPSDSSKGARS